jgi:NADPH:quinone reductase-like Zn-dependent oxidoreductase
VIDYTREDFTKNGNRYDLILGVNGHRSISEYRRALTPQGTYVMVGGAGRQIAEALMLGPLVSRRGGQTISNLMARPNQSDLTFVKELIEAGRVMPVLDRTYPLGQGADAVRYVGEGHAAGKVVVMVA